MIATTHYYPSSFTFSLKNISYQYSIVSPSCEGRKNSISLHHLSNKGFLDHHEHTSTEITEPSTMTACNYRDASSYAPVFPSPLNPTSHGPDNKYGAVRIARRRRSRAGRRGPPGSHTLTQRFLRVKAADAWRGHVLSAQVTQYEYAEAAALGVIRETKNRVSFFFSTPFQIPHTDISSLELLSFNARPQELWPQLLPLRRPSHRQQNQSARSIMPQDKTHASRHGPRRLITRPQGPRRSESSRVVMTCISRRRK